MVLSPLRLLAWVFGLLLVAVPAAAIGLFLLAVAGSPGECDTQGRALQADLSNAVAFQQTWDAMNGTLDAGQPSSATFSESEATARARLWVEQHDAPVTDLKLCFSIDSGSGSAKIDIPFFPGDVDVLVHGTLDLTGERPVAHIDDIEMGSLPGPIADRIESFVTRLIEHETDEITLQHDYGITFGEGTITLSGQP
jgi:hypothetical protein